MSYVASLTKLKNDKGKVVANGQCVRFVQDVTSAPNTAHWKAGVHVKNADHLAYGTAIATFVDGKYPNQSHGNHAAIFLSKDAQGITVLDQWVGHPVSQRKILFHGGKGNPSNDGDAFSVIE